MRLLELFEATGEDRWMNYAKSWGEHNFPSGTTAEDYDWQMIPKLVLTSLLTVLTEPEWIKFFRQEQQAWAEEGQPDRYDDLLKGPINDPVVLVKIGKKYDVVDGLHRIAASFVAGRKSIPAVIGVPKVPMHTGETVGSNDGEVNSEDDQPLPPPQHGNEEGNASWDWTDPYHSSGEQNAVMSRTP